jgi:copper chaperone CopZ
MHTATVPATVPADATATVCQRFDVVGMSCSHCETAVTAELTKLAGVTSVVVDATAGTATVESVEPLRIDDVAAAIGEAGYELEA